MKKYLWSMLAIMMAAMLSASLASCGGGDDDDNGGSNGGNNGGNGGSSTTEQVFTGTTSNVSSSAATISCNFTSSASASSLQLGVMYHTERSAVDNLQGALTFSGSVSGNTYTIELSNLYPSTVYYYRAYMISGGKTYYGSINSFTTSQEELVTTGAATDITYKSATITSSFKNTYITSYNSLGIRCSDSKEGLENGNITAWASTTVVENGNTFTVTLTNLVKNTTYYYQAYVQTYNNTSYRGEIKTFTTPDNKVDYNGHAYVDLGLPSQTLWATMNVGASAPEEFGDYYAWGETTTKTSYTEENYKWQGLTTDELVSRGVISEVPWENWDGYSHYYLTASYDAATVKWGKAWSMPTDEQIEELEKYTNIKATTQNGVNGFLLTSTVNKNSIFLPATGYYDEKGLKSTFTVDKKEYYRCYYWSSELFYIGQENVEAPNANAIWLSSYGSGMKGIDSHANRYYGCTVRPVVSY